MKKQALVETVAAVWMVAVFSLAVIGVIVSIVNVFLNNCNNPSF